MRVSRAAAFCGASVFILVAFLAARPAAQTYSSGQPVWPAFEGWEKNDDGSFTFLFGYMNENWQEELDVPIGPDNNRTADSRRIFSRVATASCSECGCPRTGATRR
jgi:hypothetical protein